MRCKVRLTESDLHKIVRESVKKVINEIKWHKASSDEFDDTEYGMQINNDEYQKLGKYDPSLNVRFADDGGYYRNRGLEGYLHYCDRNRDDSRTSDMNSDWEEMENKKKIQKQKANAEYNKRTVPLIHSVGSEGYSTYRRK